MCEEVVFLVEVQRTDKTLECPPAKFLKFQELTFKTSPLLVECLYVSQQKVSVGELFRTLWALARLNLVTVL